MAEAEWAKECFMTDPRVGRQKFDELLSQYGEDGMVYFQLAQALEYVGEITKAAKHFERARDLFFMHEWKHVAVQGIERCVLDQRLLKLPKDLRALWSDVLSMHRSPFRARAVIARACG